MASVSATNLRRSGGESPAGSAIWARPGRNKPPWHWQREPASLSCTVRRGQLSLKLGSASGQDGRWLEKPKGGPPRPLPSVKSVKSVVDLPFTDDTDFSELRRPTHVRTVHMPRRSEGEPRYDLGPVPQGRLRIASQEAAPGRRCGRVWDANGVSHTCPGNALGFSERVPYIPSRR